MTFIDILDRYGDRQAQTSASEVARHYQEVAQSAPREVVSEGLADAFRAAETPPFGEMVAQLFNLSDPEQRAGLLNQILGAVGPGALAGGPLDEIFRYLNDGSQVAPDEADTILPHQVKLIADRALEHNPGVIDRVSRFYARYPEIVGTLGTAALTIALANMARNTRH